MIRSECLSFLQNQLSVSSIRSNMRDLFGIERVPNASNFRRSARLVEKLMRSAGLTSVERITYPLDGNTRYGDLVMPPAWDCQEGYIDLVGESGRVERLADFREHPFVVAMWSPSTPSCPSEGEMAAEQKIGETAEAAGKVILVGENSRIKTVYARFKHSGALGLIYCGGGTFSFPEDYHWENSWTDHTGWYPHSVPVTMPCLNVNYKTYRRLSALASQSAPPRVRICVRSRTYSGQTDMITGTIPGRTNDEFVCLAHMYEPLLNDDASGAAALLEVARLMSAMIEKGVLRRPVRTLRFLAGWEFYGFNAYYHTHKDIMQRTFAGANFDGTGIPSRLGDLPMECRMSSPSAPSFLDAFLSAVARQSLGKHLPHLRMRPIPSTLSDDTFLSSLGFNIPIYWLHQLSGDYHHMEGNNATHMVDDMAFRAIVEAWCLGLSVVLTAQEDEVIAFAHMSVEKAICEMGEEMGVRLLRANGEDARDRIRARMEYLQAVEQARLDSALAFSRGSRAVATAVSGLRACVDKACREQLRRVRAVFPGARRRGERMGMRERRRAANIIPTRRLLGPIYCMPDVPEDRRPASPPEGARVQAWMNGARDLGTCVDMGFQEVKVAPTDKAYAQWVDYVETLSEYGYFDLDYTRE